MASLSYKLAYLEAIRVWLKYKNYKGDKRKRIYLLLQEGADSARDFLWDIKEFPNFLKISKLYEDEDITTYEDMVKRIFGKLEGTTEHDNAYYRARIQSLRDYAELSAGKKKFYQNGLVPKSERANFDKYVDKHTIEYDNSPLTFTELMTYNTWYEQHPEKVAGTMVEGSSLYFPVLVKGTKKDVENMFKAALKEQEQNEKPEDDELEMLELEAEALEIEMGIKEGLNGNKDYSKYQAFIKRALKTRIASELDCTELISEYNRRKVGRLLHKNITKVFFDCQWFATHKKPTRKQQRKKHWTKTYH